MRPSLALPFLASAALAAPFAAPFPAPLAAQTVIRLDLPDRVLSEPFSFVRGVRELSDGKLLVADWVENRVALADLGADACSDVITEGPGPQELRLPMGLVRHRGDSTLLLDYGNNRVSVLGSTGRVAYSISTDAPGIGGVRGTNASGDFYFAIPAWMERARPLADDSVRIVRGRPGSDDRRDVAIVQGTRMRKDRSPAMQPRIPTVGYASQDSWTVTPSGAIVIVRATPYRIEVIDADGTRRLGPPMPVTRRPVTTEDRRRYIREFSAGSAQSGRGPDGGMGRAPLADAAEVARQLETTEWATEHPPFDPGAVLADQRERVWVGRPAEPGKPRRYDVFDLSGRRVFEVEIGAGRRIAHVGAQGVYVVAEDRDGVQTIERYRLP